MSLTLP